MKKTNDYLEPTPICTLFIFLKESKNISKKFILILFFSLSSMDVCDNLTKDAKQPASFVKIDYLYHIVSLGHK